MMKKALVVALVTGALLAGCSEHEELPSLHGRECYVIYRRDALGYATDKHNGVKAGTVLSGRTGELAARGTLRQANDAWVVLETPEGLQAIPVSSILVVRESK